MNKLNLVLLITALAVSFTSCEKDKVTNQDQASVQSNFTVMTNGTDPLITRYSRDGIEIDFFGQRDENGVPTMVDQISVNMPNDKTIYKIDDTGRPEKIIAQNGTQFEFNWITEQKAGLTILSSDGLTQINTEIDFAETSTKSKAIKAAKSNRNNRAVSLNYREINNSSHYKSAMTNKKNCNISVYSCGGLIDADVSVLVKEKSGELLGVFPTLRIEKGQYSASIPTDIAPTINPSKICNDIVTVLNNSCVINEVPGLPTMLCMNISSALAVSGVGAPAAAAILTACTSVTAGMALYCGTLGASPAIGAPSLAEQICNAKILDRKFKQDIILYARASSIPNNSYSEFKTVTASSDFPVSLSVNMISETAIKTLKLSPASPVTQQDYTAVCNIYCLKPGTSVKLSISGSDEYTNEVFYPITSTQQEGEFTLKVPGALTGVRDVVTLEVNLPNGSVLTRTASLVFN